MLTKTVSSALAEFFIARQNLQTYNLTACAKACDNARGCKAFNICEHNSAVPRTGEISDSSSVTIAGKRDTITRNERTMTDALVFTIDYQRSPSVAPSEGDDSRCPNPPSMTNIFCSLYSTAIKAKDVSWKGEMRGKFQTVITGEFTTPGIFSLLSSYHRLEKPHVTGMQSPTKLTWGILSRIKYLQQRKRRNRS